jgi:hypothetical protein
MKRPRDPYIATWKMLNKQERLTLAIKTLKLKKFLVWPTVIFLIPMYLNIKIFLPVYLFFLLFSFLNRYSASLETAHPENFVEYNQRLAEQWKYWDEYWKERSKNDFSSDDVNNSAYDSQLMFSDKQYYYDSHSDTWRYY